MSLPVDGVFVSFMYIGDGSHDVVGSGDVIALVVVHGVTVEVGRGVAGEGLVEGAPVTSPRVWLVHPLHRRTVMSQSPVIVLQQHPQTLSTNVNLITIYCTTTQSPKDNSLSVSTFSLGV
jgi:hypothetical protein